MATNTTETQGILANAVVQDGQHLTGGMDFYTIFTIVPVTETNFGAADAGQNLVRLNEIISLQAQPVILSVTAIPTVNLSTAYATYGLGSAIDGSANSTLTSVTVYQVKFTFEHPGAWLASDFTGTVYGTLAYALAHETSLAGLPFTPVLGSGTYTAGAFVLNGTNNSGVTGSGTGTAANTSITYGNLF